MKKTIASALGAIFVSCFSIAVGAEITSAPSCFSVDLNVSVLDSEAGTYFTSATISDASGNVVSEPKLSSFAGEPSVIQIGNIQDQLIEIEVNVDKALTKADYRVTCKIDGQPDSVTNATLTSEYDQSL